MRLSEGELRIRWRGVERTKLPGGGRKALNRVAYDARKKKAREETMKMEPVRVDGRTASVMVPFLTGM